MIASILRENVLPPAVTAALLRAAALIPGVTQAPNTVSIDGHTATAVGRIQDGWRQEDLLLDPDTHEFIGYRSVAIKDFTLSVDETPTGAVPQKTTPGGTGTSANGGPVHVKKCEIQVILTRLAGRVVNGPGQTG